MTPLPDCPHCDALNTLEALRTHKREALGLVCYCQCCAKLCLVKDGVVVDAPSVVDVRGVQMHDP